MPPDRFPPDDPREWLRRARGNLAQAGCAAGQAAVLWEDVCYDCQQAAEKALKGVLIRVQGSFPRTHNIEELIRLIVDKGLTPPDEVLKASGLTEYATGPRYPGDYEPVTGPDYEEARQWAEAVLEWAGTIIGG